MSVLDTDYDNDGVTIIMTDDDSEQYVDDDYDDYIDYIDGNYVLIRTIAFMQNNVSHKNPPNM